MKEYILKSLNGRQFEEKEITVSEIEFSTHVVDACKLNHCGRYKKSWSCPPAVGSLDTLKAKYQGFENAYVFTTKSDLEDCFDVEGMDNARVAHTMITDDVIDALKKQEKAFAVLGAGSCCKCKECTYPDMPCRFPQKVYPSVEACGIDVVALSRTCGINYINGQNTVTYFSVIFY